MSMSTERQQYIAGLRQLADLMEKHDDLPLPTHGDIDWLLFGYGNDYETQKASAAQIVRRLGNASKYVTEELFRFQYKLAGLTGEVVVHRDAVCERVVTGTREVVEMVPDPAVDVPLVEVTKTVEDVEWVCAPLLSEAATP